MLQIYTNSEKKVKENTFTFDKISLTGGETLNIHKVFVSARITDGLENLCSKLISKGAEIIADESTYAFLKLKKITVKNLREFFETEVADDFALQRRIVSCLSGANEEKATCGSNNKHIDLLVVNFEPFSTYVEKTGNETELVEHIDSFKPSLVLSAAKNYRNVVVLCDPEDYEDVLEDLEYYGDVSLQRRRKLALKALYLLSAYTSEIYSVFSEIFAEEKYNYLILEKIMPLMFGEMSLKKSTLYKVSGICGILDDVHIANPSVAMNHSHIRSVLQFMRLYYFFGDVSAFISDGKLIEVSLRGNMETIHHGESVMYGSSFPISYPMIKRLYATGVKSFCGVFEKEAVRYAHDNDILLLTIPERNSLSVAKFNFVGFENYIALEENKFPKMDRFSSTEKLAVITSYFNPKISLALVETDNEHSITINVDSENRLRTAIFGFNSLNGYVLACNVDLSDETVELLRSKGVNKMYLPCVSKTYNSVDIIPII